MNKPAVINITNLSKSFDYEKVLRDINLSIPRGSITGIVGANGAGKSTLLRIMTGIYLADTGTCMTLGQHAGKLGAEQFRRIGYVHQEGKLIGWMYVHQLIDFVAGHYPDSWNRALVDKFVARFELPLKVKVSTLSPGKRQQLAILLAIGFEPELLIMDEPASGLDPLARFEFLQLLLDFIQDDNRTVIISSHILSDIEQIIDHVVIFKRGEIIRSCPFDVLQEEFVQVQMTSRTGDLPPLGDVGGKVFTEQAGSQALVIFRRDGFDADYLAGKTGCEIRELPLNFESIYRLIVSPQHFRHRPMEQDQ